MQTQAKVQLDERDKNPGVVRQPFNPLQVEHFFRVCDFTPALISLVFRAGCLALQK